MSQANSWQIKFLAILLALAVSSCSVNILEEFSDKATNEALLMDAKELINDRDYTEALAKFAEMTPEFLGRRTTKFYHATAYAGRCGLDFLNLVSDLQDIGTTRLLVFLLQSFGSGTTQRMNDCIAAEDLLESIGTTASTRDTDENLLISLVSFAKIGFVLSQFGDASPADGTVDGGFDPCTSGDIADTEVAQVGTGITIALDSLSAVSGTIDVAASEISSINTLCSSLPMGFNFCSKTDPTAFTANELKGIRSLINESSALGLGTCTGDVTACACP